MERWKLISVPRAFLSSLHVEFSADSVSLGHGRTELAGQEPDKQLNMKGEEVH